MAEIAKKIFFFIFPPSLSAEQLVPFLGLNTEEIAVPIPIVGSLGNEPKRKFLKFPEFPITYHLT